MKKIESSPADFNPADFSPGDLNSGDLKKRFFVPTTILSAICALCAFAILCGLGSKAVLAGRQAAILVDSHSGAVLYRKKADDLRYPASLTKIMTLYLLFEALDQGKLSLYTPLYVSKKAARQQPSKLGLKARSRILVHDAILALVTKSANDVAVVVAEALGKNERAFAKLMTSRARAIGMMKTHFRNASGLPNKSQVTTARDMALLALALMRDFPHYYRYFSTTNFHHQGQFYKNHNKLLRSYTGADGIKTGYTLDSGYNLVASAVRANRRLIAVVMGGSTSRTRDRRTEEILDWGFAHTAKEKGKRVLAKNQSIFRHLRSPHPISWQQSAKHRQQPRSHRRVSPVKITGWSIQVGAFSRYASAQNVIEKASSYLFPAIGPTQSLVSPVHYHGKILYRARLLGFGPKSALSACVLLSDRDIPCHPVR